MRELNLGEGRPDNAEKIIVSVEPKKYLMKIRRDLMKKWFCILGIAITLLGVVALTACGSSTTSSSTTSTSTSTTQVTTTSSTTQATTSQTTAAATTTKSNLLTLPTGSSPDLVLANKEVNQVREAAYKYMGSHSGTFPANSDALVGTILASKPDGSYTFNTHSGAITAATAGTNITKGFTWDLVTNYWK
jgi:hypothetical protein